MMTIEQLQKEIIRMKKEQGVSIFAHSYQAHEILEIADYTGDSYALAVKAQQDDAKTCLMCGVNFMAETMKILSPEKKVLVPCPEAGCPMAEQFTPEEILAEKAKHPDCIVMAYINTTAALKTVCDVCVTSGSALKICEKLDADEILFIPDCNLGAFCAERFPEKKFHLMNGGCPVHAAITGEEAEKAKKKHPNAKLLVHPECRSEVVVHADFAGSTAAIMEYVRKSDENEFIIGTENSIAEHLQYEFPDRKFYLLSPRLICTDMKMTTLVDVYNTLKGTAGAEIVIDDETMTKAKVCIDRMLEMGG